MPVRRALPQLFFRHAQKYLIADVDTYRKGPEDDIYPGHPINYVKRDRLPGPADDWTPILQSIRNGDFWVSTGEILIKNYAVQGTGAKRTVAADVEFDATGKVWVRFAVWDSAGNGAFTQPSWLNAPGRTILMGPASSSTQ